MGRKPTTRYNLKTKYPDVAKEWDYKKNKTKPEEYLPASTKKAWWICKKNHSYFASIGERTRKKTISNSGIIKKATGCPKCAIIKSSRF